MTVPRPVIHNPPVRQPLLETAPVSHDTAMFEAQFGDRTYRIFLACPRQTPPRGGFPILYLLDGNAAFAEIDPAALAARPDLAIAAIGYPTAHGFDFDSRSRDYTPPAPPGWTGGERQALLRPHGEAARFLDLLTGPISERVEARIPVDTSRRGLWGHSYGGLFCLHALQQGMSAFDTLHVASPSLWWGDGAVEAALGADWAPERTLRLELYAGGNEIQSGMTTPLDPARIERLARTLDARRDLACRRHIFPGAGHRETFSLALARAITTA